MSADDITPGLRAAGVRMTSLDEESLYSVLAASRRRDVIRILDDVGTVSMKDLATRLAAHEFDHELDGVPYDVRKTVYVTLQQCHLSKLEEAGVIEQERDTIRPTAEVANLAGLLRVTTGTGGEAE